MDVGWQRLRGWWTERGSRERASQEHSPEDLPAWRVRQGMGTVRLRKASLRRVAGRVWSPDRVFDLGPDKGWREDFARAWSGRILVPALPAELSALELLDGLP